MMSDTQTVDEVVDDTVDPPIVETETHEGPSAEEAMAQMRRELEATQAERDAALQKAATAGAGMMTANEVAINEAIQNTEAQLKQQRAAYRAARESGDLDAEQQANEESAVLRLRLDGLTRDKARMKAAPPPQQQQNQSRIPGPAARQWMNDHPKINSDPTYAHAAESAHNRAIANGHEPESPGYFQSINADLERSFGPDHGRDAVSQSRQPAAPAAKPRTAPAASSYATPPGRGNAGARPGTDVKAIAARLGVSESDVVDAADICKMSVADYCKKQADILAEQGGRTITYGDGAVYR